MDDISIQTLYRSSRGPFWIIRIGRHHGQAYRQDFNIAQTHLAQTIGFSSRHLCLCFDDSRTARRNGRNVSLSTPIMANVVVIVNSTICIAASTNNNTSIWSCLGILDHVPRSTRRTQGTVTRSSTQCFRNESRYTTTIMGTRESDPGNTGKCQCQSSLAAMVCCLLWMACLDLYLSGGDWKCFGMGVASCSGTIWGLLLKGFFF